MSDPIVPRKTCTKCNQEFPATTEHFYKNAKALDGLEWQCRECRLTHMHERYANDPEYREKKAAYKRERNTLPEVLERKRAQAREYSARPEVREKVAPRDRERRANDPEYRQKRNASTHNRCAAEGKFTAADVQLQYKSQKGKCWHCGKLVGDNYHIDHLIPLARGGTNWPKNIVISCIVCNRSKGAKLTQDWNGRLF